MSDSLLRVREAADLLGVHVDTVRRWTDEGRLAAVRTPGGHRRISREAVERLRGDGAGTGSVSTTAPHPDAGAPEDRAWAAHALVHARYQLESRPGGGWRDSLSPDDREQSRETGRRLFSLLSQHVSRTVDEDVLWPEVERLARDYAALLRTAGVPYGAALRGAQFFRDALSESIAFYPESGGRSGTEVLRDVNAFTNAVELAIAEAYDLDGASGTD